MPRNIGEYKKNEYVEDFQIRDDLISSLKRRFSTYGYRQIRTSAFEYYDMYTDITGTINKDEMIKVIDTTGKVLVLRPDVTIPLTRLTASGRQSILDRQRLFYVLDVFRQSGREDNKKESTQAGIEYFGDNTPEADAEVIMLAIHTLKDLGFRNFKLEIGHAGFFKELIGQAALDAQDLKMLQTLIQSKNMVEIEPFLDRLDIEEDLKLAIQSIPLLYGEPEAVIAQSNKIIRNSRMGEILQNLIDVFEILKDYGAENHIAFNLGLINNMNYYTGVIFQGFVDRVGTPVLMGGRYDNLGEQFSRQMDAIGFAFEVDVLLEAVKQQGLNRPVSEMPDIIIYYEKSRQRKALTAAYQLRCDGYRVLVQSSDRHAGPIQAFIEITYSSSENTIRHSDDAITFTDQEEILPILERCKEDN